MNDLTLDRDAIVGLLTQLGTALDRQGVRAEMFVVGGAAMALAYNIRRMTRDIDGVFEPKTVVYAAAREIAMDQGIPDDWRQ